MFPFTDQIPLPPAPAEEMVSVFPTGSIVTLVPATSVISSFNVFRLVTPAPGAALAAVPAARAYSAYGVGVNCWRGAMAAKVFAPFVPANYSRSARLDGWDEGEVLGLSTGCSWCPATRRCLIIRIVSAAA